MTFNVRDFGAAGDGITSDRAAIQAAIDAAHAAGGGTVYLPTGIYSIADVTKPQFAIRVLSNVTLAGDGMGLTVIRAADGANQIINGLVRTPPGEVTENVVLRDFTIDGNRDNNPSGMVIGLYTGVTPGSPLQDNNIRVERVEAMNNSSYAFDPHEQTNNLVMTGNLAHDNGLDGFVADYVIGSRYENNFAWNNARHGFNIITQTHDFVSLNNYAWGNGSTGLTVQRGGEPIPVLYNITVQGGAYYDNAQEGIRLQMADHVSLLDSDVFGNGRWGVRIKGSTETVIDGNVIRNNGQVKHGSYDEVEIVRHDDGTTVYDSVNTTIQNNILYADGSVRTA